MNIDLITININGAIHLYGLERLVSGLGRVGLSIAALRTVRDVLDGGEVSIKSGGRDVLDVDVLDVNVLVAEDTSQTHHIN
jgi:hypothetical protein